MVEPYLGVREMICGRIACTFAVLCCIKIRSGNFAKISVSAEAALYSTLKYWEFADVPKRFISLPGDDPLFAWIRLLTTAQGTGVKMYDGPSLLNPACKQARAAALTNAPSFPLWLWAIAAISTVTAFVTCHEQRTITECTQSASLSTSAVRACQL